MPYKNLKYTKLTEIISAFHRSLQIRAKMAGSGVIQRQTCPDTFVSDLTFRPQKEQYAVIVYIERWFYSILKFISAYSLGRDHPRPPRLGAYLICKWLHPNVTKIKQIVALSTVVTLSHLLQSPF